MAKQHLAMQGGKHRKTNHYTPLHTMKTEKTIHQYIDSRLEAVSSKTGNMKKRFNEYALIAIETDNPNAWKTHKAHLESWENYAGRLQALEDLGKHKTAYAIHCFISNQMHDSTGRFVTEFQKGFLDELSRAAYVLANLNVFEEGGITR